MSRSAVKAKLGNPASDASTGMVYNEYSNNAPLLLCMFDNSAKLTSYTVMVKTAYSSELGAFLVERYVPLAYQDYTFAFVNGLDNSTVTMGIGAKLYNLSYWMTFYFPYTPTTRGELAADHSGIIKSIDELMK